jgi:hypothetical protein
MDKQKQITALTESSFGGSLWERYGKCRVYFEGASIATRQGLKTSRYNSGNISSATLNGEKISNSEAKRILKAFQYFKIWYDFADGKFHIKPLAYKTELGNTYASEMYDAFTADAFRAIRAFS